MKKRTYRNLTVKVARMVLGVCSFISMLYLTMELVKYREAKEEYRRLAGEFDSRLETAGKFGDRLETEGEFDICLETAGEFDSHLETAGEFGVRLETAGEFDSHLETAGEFDCYMEIGKENDSRLGMAKEFDSHPGMAEIREEKPARELTADYLRRRNPDYAFWLTIPDTHINYPVMEEQIKGYYLNHTFEGTENPAGCLFISEDEGVLPRDNTIIYGHNRKDGSMFADLKQYVHKEYYEEHPKLYILEENGWQSYAVFSCQIRQEIDDSIYYSWFADSNAKKEYLGEMCANSLYETEIKPECSDRLITLSTCYGSKKRMIVQAVLLCYTE